MTYYKNRRPPMRKAGRFMQLLLILVVLSGIAIAAVGYAAYQEVKQVEQQGTFYPGIYVDNIALHGATPQEAYNYLVAKATAAIEDWHIDLHYAGTVWQITPNDLGLGDSISQAVMDALNNAFMVGRTGNTLFERYRVISALKETPYHSYTASIEKNTLWIDALISEIQAAVFQPAMDATLVFDPDRQNPIVITPEVYGRQLDATALYARIMEMVSSMEADTIVIEPQEIPPAVLASDLENRVVLLGSFASEINTKSTHERNLNIERGCQAFHGKTIAPDEKVSFNRWVGKRTEKNGFYPAQEIVSGAYEMGIGGGICQVSSALYNAVVQANLRIRERRNHGIPIQYLEMGADATVYDDRIDFVFQNNTGEPVYLIARLVSSDGGKKKACLFQIYGRPDPSGYTYSMEHEVIEEIPIPEPTVIQDKKQAYVVYKDQSHEEFSGRKGYVVRTYLVTKDGNTIVDRSEMYVDTYKAQAPRVYVGVMSRD